MHKRTSIKQDENQIANNLMKQVTGEGKNLAAVALGRLGGLKGGKARAKKLSSKQRRDIAQKAAEIRWSRGK